MGFVSENEKDTKHRIKVCELFDHAVTNVIFPDTLQLPVLINIFGESVHISIKKIKSANMIHK